MSRDSFAIEGPALISFSGGRSSAFMLWRIVRAHGGTLPADVHVTFANTGKELPQTLAFVRDCGERWGVAVTWLEFQPHADPQQRWQRVEPAAAATAGEPFSALIAQKNYLPNPVTRFCTFDLKIRPMKLYAQALGWDRWTTVLGLRADEPGRVAKARRRSESNKEPWDTAMPLAAAGVTKAAVESFWSRQNFDLKLPNVGGTTPAGNCDLCFLKSAATISGMMRGLPDLATWWIEAEAEAEAKTTKPSGARFRNDRPGYGEMFKAVKEQRAFDFGERDELVDCFCGDGA